MALIRNANAKILARNAIVMDLADVRAQGEMLVEHATKRARAIVTEAEAERARLIQGASQLGHKEGYEKGVAEGRAAGTAKGRDEALRESRQRLDELQRSWVAELAAFQSRRDDMLRGARNSILTLCMEIAQKIVKRAIELDTSIVVDQVAGVLDMTVLPSRLTLSINPQDRQLVHDALPALLSACTMARHVELIDDPRLARGSCNAVATRDVGSGSSPRASDGVLQIDASIDGQLERITETLLPRAAM